MARIFVEFAGLQKMGDEMEAASSRLDAIRNDFQNTVRGLDWDVRFWSDINSTATQITRRIQRQRISLKSYKRFLDQAYRMYSELDAVKFELEVLAGRTNIFDGTNGYGGDQGDMDHNKNGVKLFWWVFGEDKEIYDFVRQQEGYESYSEADIHKLLSKINNEGCGYVALVNTLFWEFQGTEDEFEELYGFPMHDENGNYNFNRMLIDIYCKTDDKFFLTEDSGKTALVIEVLRDYQDHPERFEQDFGVPYDPSADDIPNAVINGILNRYNSDVVTLESEGTDSYTQQNRLLAYLHEKGIDADVSCSTQETMSMESVRNSLESGTVVKLSLGKGAELCDENGNVQSTLNGSHAVVITEITDDGRYVISSWGEQYYVDPTQLYTDPSTGNTNSVINSYLSINVNYR